MPYFDELTLLMGGGARVDELFDPRNTLSHQRWLERL